MRRRRALAALAAALGPIFASSPALAADGTWTNNNSSTWSTATNWSGSVVADGAGFTANFTNDITADRIVTLDSARIIGNLVFTDTSNTWTLSGANTLTLTSSGTDAQIDLTVNDRQTGTISLLLSSAEDVEKEGIGTLVLSNTSNTITGGVIVNGGTLHLPTSFSPAGGQPITINANGVVTTDFAVTQAELLANTTSGSAGSFALHSPTGIAGLDLTTRPGLHLGARAGQTVVQDNIILDAADTSYNFGGGGGNLTITADLGNGAGARNLVVFSPSATATGSGSAYQTVVTLSGNNSFTGTTTVGQHSALLYGSVAAMGNGTGRSITVNAGGVVGPAAGHTIADLQTGLLDKIATASAGTFGIAGTESQNLNFSAFSTLRLGAVGSGTLSGTVTANSDNILRLGGSGALTISSTLPTSITSINLDIEPAGSATRAASVRFTANNSALNVPISVGPTVSSTNGTITLLIGGPNEIGNGTITIVDNSGRVRLLDGAVLNNNVILSSTGGSSKVFGTDSTNVVSTMNGNITANDTNDRENDIDVLAGTLIMNGLLNGLGDIEKTSGGTLVLTNPGNTVAQRFDVTSGVVRFTYNVPNTFALGVSAGIFMTSGAIELADGITIDESITFSDNTGKTLRLQSGVARTGAMNAPIVFGETNTGIEQTFAAADGILTINGSISSTTSITPYGITGTNATQGTVVLANAANSQTHRVVLDSGFLRISQESNLGANPAAFAANQILLSGGILETTATFALDDPNRGISIDADSAIRVLSGTTLTIQNVITTVSGSLLDDEFMKRGGGTLVLNRANTYVGETQVYDGTLRLDFAAAGAPASNILYNGLTLVTENELQLSGARFEAIGLSATANSQAFFDSQFAVGASEISLTAGGSGGTMSVNIGAITRDPGAVVNFVLPAGTSVITTAGTANTILTASTGQPYATLGGTDWAARGADGTSIVSGATISGFYTANTASTLTGNADIAAVDTTLAAASTPTSVRFNENAARTITINSGQTLTTGGILVTSNVGANTTSISGGTLRTSNTGTSDFPIIQNNTAGDLVISSVIANNTGAKALTKAGEGRLVLTGANTFTGQTYLMGGTLSISSNANLGAPATGATIDIDGATLEVTANVSLDNAGANLRAIDLGDKGGTFKVTGTNRLTISGVVSRDGTDLSINGLTKTDTGTLVLRGVNIYSGPTTVTGGILQVGDTTSTTAITGNNSTRNLLTVAPGATLTGTGTIAGAGAATPHSILGTLSPGATTTNAGDGEATLTVNGDLSLGAGSNTILSLNAPTGNAGVTDPLSLPTVNPGLLTGTIAAGTHDHLDVSHTLSLTNTGTITVDVATLGAYSSPAYGDVFNLIDADSIAAGTFNIGPRFQDGTETGLDLDLPVLSDGMSWDTGLFASHGALVVVPEPGAALGLIGAAGLLLRRRRQRA